MSETVKRTVPMPVWQTLLGILLLAAWEWGSTAGLLDKFFFSRPSEVAGRVLHGWPPARCGRTC